MVVMGPGSRESVHPDCTGHKGKRWNVDWWIIHCFIYFCLAGKKNVIRVRIYPDPTLDHEGSGLGPEILYLEGMSPGLGPSFTTRVWTSEVLHFGVETTNHAESEHSVLKLWLSTCHGDLDTVFLNIDALIEGQIFEIKTSLEISRLKEKYDAKSNPILKNISNNISHLALKKIWLEINRTRETSDDPQSKCRNYLRKSHSLPCACELDSRYAHALLFQVEDIYIFWGKLEIDVDIPNVHERDMDSEMRDITSMLEEISMGLISKSGKKIEKSSRLGSGSGSGFGSGSGPSPRGRGRPPVLVWLHMRDGCPLPPMHVQWQYHQDVGVSGWADHYYDRIAEWVRRSRTEYPTRGATHVVIP
ncbi:hypothetical protein M9H77_22224 [Catharanthus roseus]|uniref:Uncharacterized protein n=1 Tax=Catharanthus roseus TaxID=4058 RepID=A0ACC0AQK3_CATRO|nr:hypothetical protein M9H77_22224 [Catharanthus roseus]